MTEPIIETRNLRKVYSAPGSRRSGAPPGVPTSPAAPRGGAGIVALAGVDLDVRAGEFFGLLGPNGAGKTTMIGILTTRVRLTSGEARVAGADVQREPSAVKRRIGIVPQRPNPDRALNILENLVFHAAYFGIAESVADSRARELLARFGLAERATSKVDHLSGGQQQRLMIARALMHDPDVIFLDEPTVGLDPQARLAVWELLRELHATGRTIVMTTHYMEEADQLCERVAIIDRGHLLTLDTPANLKAQAPGGTLIELVLGADAAPILDAVRTAPGVLRADAERNVLRTYAERTGATVPALFRIAEDAGIDVRDVHLAAPSLETLFIDLTGRKLD